MFFQRFTILVSGRYFCDPLVLGQKEISDQSQSRDGAVLTNGKRVFSDPWLTAPRRPERSIICQSQYQEQPDLYRTRERDKRRGDNNNKHILDLKVYIFIQAMYFHFSSSSSLGSCFIFIHLCVNT